MVKIYSINIISIMTKCNHVQGVQSDKVKIPKIFYCKFIDAEFIYFFQTEIEYKDFLAANYPNILEGNI